MEGVINQTFQGMYLQYKKNDNKVIFFFKQL